MSVSAASVQGCGKTRQPHAPPARPSPAQRPPPSPGSGRIFSGSASNNRPRSRLSMPIGSQRAPLARQRQHFQLHIRVGPFHSISQPGFQPNPHPPRRPRARRRLPVPPRRSRKPGQPSLHRHQPEPHRSRPPTNRHAGPLHLYTHFRFNELFDKHFDQQRPLRRAGPAHRGQAWPRPHRITMSSRRRHPFVASARTCPDRPSHGPPPGHNAVRTPGPNRAARAPRRRPQQ